ncbi:GNAT family N-acetyltransferase [Pontibacter sp. MBLB2868]|uniref:GNAT family N-acetyltransferase n=1 Tax=Pontibacter sp. MBLB2868 TaxID=3451555 RepID=UPI003F751F5D
MIVRNVKENELWEVVDLWFETSVRAHNFIAADFWERNRHAMATKYLPNAETYVAFVEKEIIGGFISMVENYLAAVFVRPQMQGMGLGKRLLAHVKDTRQSI